MRQMRVENRLGNKFVSHRCQYYLSERHALMMLRIPRMIEHVKQKLGKQDVWKLFRNE